MGGLTHQVHVNIRWVDSEDIELHGAEQALEGVDGVLVPGSFGYRGVEGKIQAITWARETKTPYFGICMGMQAAAIEIARNVAGLKEANSTEFVPDTPYPVIDLMPEQQGVVDMGGTMRLGSYPCALRVGTKTQAIYQDTLILNGTVTALN